MVEGLIGDDNGSGVVGGFGLARTEDLLGARRRRPYYTPD